MLILLIGVQNIVSAPIERIFAQSRHFRSHAAWLITSTTPLTTHRMPHSGVAERRVNCAADAITKRRNRRWE